MPQAGLIPTLSGCVIVFALVSIVIAIFLARARARALALTLPFRVRPIYTSGIGFQPLSLRPPRNLTAEDWSSFPCDHSAMWFAFTYGLWRLSRPIGIIAALFGAVWVCAVRVYLGLHYPSDIVAGAIIGLVCGYAMQRMGGPRLANHVLVFERIHPQAFYAAAFLVTFEIAMIFDDVRQLMRGAARALRPAGFGSAKLMGALAVDVGAALIIAAIVWWIFNWWRRRG